MSCARQGDWMCGACQYVNFQKRDMCQRCTCPKAADVNMMMMMSASYHQKAAAEAGVLAGDWYCGGCGAHNYASRSCCYRCCASKQLSASDHNNYYGYAAATDAAAVPGWKTGDWICNRYGCSMHNYASRLECLKCHSPRD